MDTNRFAASKIIAAFDINDNFIANVVVVDNSNGFYDFIDSIVVEDFDDFVDRYTLAD